MRASPYRDSELAGMLIVEDARLVVLGPLVTVRRSWRERLYDWPWNPWQATRVERPWVPRRDALYDSKNRVFYVHPAFAAALRSQITAVWHGPAKNNGPWQADHYDYRTE